MSLNQLPGIANPQNTKGLGHFLTTDSRPGGFEIRRKRKGSTYETGGFVIPL